MSNPTSLSRQETPPNTVVHQLRATRPESLAPLGRYYAPSARTNQSLPLKTTAPACLHGLVRWPSRQPHPRHSRFPHADPSLTPDRHFPRPPAPAHRPTHRSHRSVDGPPTDYPRAATHTLHTPYSVLTRRTTTRPVPRRERAQPNNAATDAEALTPTTSGAPAMATSHQRLTSSFPGARPPNTTFGLARHT